MGYDPGGKPRPGQYFDRRHPFVPEAGWWMLNERGGLIAHDLLGMNHGTLVGPTWRGGALNFDGGDWIWAADNLTFRMTSNMSISCMIKTTKQSWACFVSKMGSGGSRSYELSMNTDGTAVIYLASNASTLVSRSSTGVIDDNEWHHILGAYNAQDLTLDIYIDGIKDNGTLSGTIPSSQYSANGMNINIGRRSNADVDSYVVGSLDDIRIYNRELIEAEVNALFVNSFGEYAEFPKPVVYFLPPVAEAIAPTSVLYGPLVGPLSGPV